MSPSNQQRESVLRGLWSRFKDADLSILAAAVAYNTFLALVPLTLALVGIASIIGGDASALDRVESTLVAVAPETVVDFIVSLMRDAEVRVGGASWLFIVGSVLVALFLGARAVVALQKALAIVEDETEQRPAAQMRLVAIVLTIAGGAALLITSFLLIVGQAIADFIAELTGVSALETVWVWVRIPVSSIGLFLFLLAFYRWGPPSPLPRARLAALVATAGAVLASLGFGAYLSVSPELGATFGVIGAVAVALVWLYLGAFAILLGGVVAAYLERWLVGTLGFSGTARAALRAPDPDVDD